MHQVGNQYIARQLSLTWARLIHPMPSHPISLKSVLILLYHLSLGLLSDLFPSGFPTKSVYFASPSTHHVPRAPYTLRFYRSSNIWRDVIVKVAFNLYAIFSSLLLLPRPLTKVSSLKGNEKGTWVILYQKKNFQSTQNNLQPASLEYTCSSLDYIFQLPLWTKFSKYSTKRSSRYNTAKEKRNSVAIF